MKTKTWILILGAVALLLALVCLWQFIGRPGAACAEISVDGRLVQTVDLSVDQRFTVEGVGGSNVVVVEGGKIRVAEADCPGGDCIRTGARSSGPPIVCLPHRVVIAFTDSGGVDGIAG